MSSKMSKLSDLTSKVDSERGFKVWTGNMASETVALKAGLNFDSDSVDALFSSAGSYGAYDLSFSSVL